LLAVRLQVAPDLLNWQRLPGRPTIHVRTPPKAMLVPFTKSLLVRNNTTLASLPCAPEMVRDTGGTEARNPIDALGAKSADDAILAVPHGKMRQRRSLPHCY